MKSDPHLKALSNAKFSRLWGSKVAEAGFTQVPRMLIQNPRAIHPKLGTQHLSILVYLVSRWNYGNNPFPSIATMAKDLKQGKDSLQRKINDMIDWGLITKGKSNRAKTKGKYRNNEYDLSGLAKTIEKRLKEQSNK